MASERKIIAENIRRVLLKEYLMKEVSRAGFGGLDVQRTPVGTRVTLTTERPGIVIGKKGSTIKALTRAIENDFEFENPQIEVQEVGNSALNAQIMAEKLAFSLERGWHFRRAGHSTIRRITESGAKGCQVILSGKLTGQRHRVEKFKSGYIKFCGEPRLQFIDEGFALAKIKRGTIGVKVEIMQPGSKLPDEVDVVSREEAIAMFPELAEVKSNIPVAVKPRDEEPETVEVPVEAPVEEPETVEEAVEAPVEEPEVVETVEAPVEEPTEDGGEE